MTARVALLVCVAACGRLGFGDDRGVDGGPGGDARPTDAVATNDGPPMDAAPVDGPAGQLVCNADCRYTQSVNARCAIAGCQMTCDLGATCRFECPLGGCDFICTNGAICTTTCDVGQCDTTTSSGAHSTGTCLGQCDVFCDVSAGSCGQTCSLPASCTCDAC